jgi:hypothetical protein
MFRILLFFSNSIAGSNEPHGRNESRGFSMFLCFPELTVYLIGGFSRQKLTDLLYGEVRTAS